MRNDSSEEEGKGEMEDEGTGQGSGVAAGEKKETLVQQQESGESHEGGPRYKSLQSEELRPRN